MAFLLEMVLEFVDAFLSRWAFGYPGYLFARYVLRRRELDPDDATGWPCMLLGFALWLVLVAVFLISERHWGT